MLTLLLFGAAQVALSSVAEAGSFALAPVRGPKGAAPREVERAILDRFEARGDEAHLGDPRPGEHVLSVDIEKRGRVYVAQLSLSRPGEPTPVARRSATYHPRRGVSSTLAVLLDRLLDRTSAATEAGEEEAEASASPEETTREGEPPEVPPEEVEDVEVEAPGLRVAAEAESETSRWSVELGVGLGTQMLSRYTLSVAEGPTALAYGTSPLFLISPIVRVRLSGIPLWFLLQGDIAPVGFLLSTDPPLTPEVASGAFLGLGFRAGWVFELVGSFTLAPVLGLRVESLGVDPQTATVLADDGTPAVTAFDVVLSARALVPELGFEARYELTPDLQLALEARFRLIASYAETPAASGDAGSGVGVVIGGGAEWSLRSWLALELQLRYQYSAVSFSGVASRVAFADDPPLVDASADFEDLKLTLGPRFRF